jgi:type I restriction enzyme S subunit
MLLLQYFDELTLQPQNAKKLKGLILELAVRGKLTKKWRIENPNTESATELLTQIKAEKKRLIAKKKIKKESPLPKIDVEESPFDLPESWVWCRLGEVIKTILGGGTPSKRNPDYWNGDIPWASVKDLKNYKYLIKTVDKISDLGLTKSSSNFIPVNNLILCTRMGLGKICINKIPVAINQDLKAVFLTKHLEIDFFYNAYKTLEIVGTGVTVSGIKQSELLKLPFPLPPLSEQKAIVKIVEQLFEEVEILERLTEERLLIKQNYTTAILNRLANKNTEATWQQLLPQFEQFFDTEKSIKALRQTILQLAVQGKLTKDWRKANPNTASATELLQQIKTEKKRLIAEKVIKKEKVLPKIKAEEIPFELPENWVWCRLKEVTHNLGQKKPNTDFQYIDVSAIDNEKGIIKDTISTISFVKAPSRARKILKKGTVIYSTVRPYLKNIAIIEKDYYPEVIASTAFAILYPTANYSSKYLFYYLRSAVFTEYVESKMKGVSYPAINDKNFFMGLISFPPIEEQKAIVKKIEQIFQFCDELEISVTKKLEGLDLLMNGILNQILGVNSFETKSKNDNKIEQKLSRLIIFDSKTIFMDLVELLKTHGELHAEDLWKMSKFPNDIDAFYAALKNEVEVSNTIKESAKKGYLELI